MFAPIDDGAHILVHTPHSVVAAPYHRDQQGNRTAMDAFLAGPEDAESIVRATGAGYVALCPAESGIELLTREAPHGLAAALVQGSVPAWLQPVPLPDTPYRVFRLK